MPTPAPTVPDLAPPVPAFLSPITPEQSATEILNAWLKSYFTGTAHASPLGDQTFPICNLLFNQQVIPQGLAKPTIHCEFIEWPTKEQWFRRDSGTLGTWQAVLGRPASGVSYGLCDGNVVESVHGVALRTLPGTAIRWEQSGSDLLEQTLQGGTWTTVRTIPNATGIQWVRASEAPGSAYIEETVDSFTLLRSFTPNDPVWDGAMKVVEGRATLLWHVQVDTAGDNRAEWTARTTASQLESLFRDPYATMPLQQRGMKSWSVLNAQRSTGTTAAQVRWFATTTQVRYFIPRENVS